MVSLGKLDILTVLGPWSQMTKILPSAEQHCSPAGPPGLPSLPPSPSAQPPLSYIPGQSSGPSRTSASGARAIYHHASNILCYQRESHNYMLVKRERKKKKKEKPQYHQMWKFSHIPIHLYFRTCPAPGTTGHSSLQLPCGILSWQGAGVVWAPCGGASPAGHLRNSALESALFLHSGTQGRRSPSLFRIPQRCVFEVISLALKLAVK